MLCCATSMSWYRKENETRFDVTPVEGLFFVDGNIFERINRREYVWGMKCPKVVFPSGEDFELWDEQRFLSHQSKMLVLDKGLKPLVGTRFLLADFRTLAYG